MYKYRQQLTTIEPKIYSIISNKFVMKEIYISKSMESCDINAIVYNTFFGWGIQKSS